MPPAPLTSSAIIGAVAAFFGATGFLAALGFLVQQSLFTLLGAPAPPFATIDYLRVAGYFLFDLIVVVVLLYGVLWFVIPALLLLVLFSVVLALRRPRVRSPAQFAVRYGRAWQWVEHRWHRWCDGRAGLLACLALLIVFTFAYHYPVFAQRGIAERSAGATSEAGCPRPAAIDALWQPLRFGWEAVDARCSRIRRILLVEGELGTTQAIYANGTLLLLALTLYVVMHPYDQLSPAGRAHSQGRRWLWSMNAVLVAVSLAFLPNGYGVLFRDKQAPHVRFEFRDEPKEPASAWRERVVFRTWSLVFQNDQEVWLYSAPDMVVLPKDQLVGLEILDRHWIFE